ncbi:MAG TPA: hypothetical protein VHT21_03030 [Stellaceae bacterium]|jgi:ABC-type enterochelin transport system permease subunit|nr:hypothetical protein [Stellaceae bacterium]
MDADNVLKILDNILPPPVFYGADQLTISKHVGRISPFVGVILAAVLKYKLGVKIASLLLAVLLFGAYWGILRDIAGFWIFWVQQMVRALCLVLFGYALMALIGEGARKAVHELRKPGGSEVNRE